MSSNIINFPTHKDRIWEETSNNMKILLLEQGFGENEANKFISKFKPIFEEYTFTFSSEIKLVDSRDGPPVEEWLFKFKSAYSSHFQEVIWSRFGREVDIYLNFIHKDDL